MKNTFLTLSLLASGAVLSAANVSNVTVTRNETTKLVLVTYELSEPAIVTGVLMTNGAPVVTHSLGGVINKYVEAAGTHVFCWQPRESDGGFAVDANTLTAEVKSWTLETPPAYMTVEIGNRMLRRYYNAAEALPEGVESDRYRQKEFLLRHIPAAGKCCRLGANPAEYGVNSQANCSEPSRYVSFTNDYYLGVFEMTQAQFERFMANPSADAIGPNYPVNNFGYEGALRGWRASGCRWPQDGHSTAGDTFLTALRVGYSWKYVFDLPTEAQWEFAARAGSDTELPFNVRATNDTSLAEALLPYAWTQDNGGNKLHEVGLKRPNGFGLYDMLGNADEAVLDSWKEAENATLCQSVLIGDGHPIEPSGWETTEREQFIVRGGSVNDSSDRSYRLSSRAGCAYRASVRTYGSFRLWCPLPTEQGPSLPAPIN